jgi:hypothetical protein
MMATDRTRLTLPLCPIVAVYRFTDIVCGVGMFPGCPGKWMVFQVERTRRGFVYARSNSPPGHVQIQGLRNAAARGYDP